MNQNPSGSAKRVTRDVEPGAVADLLDRPPRAALAFVDAEQVEILPVRARLLGGTHLFVVRTGGAPNLDGREVLLVRDDGPSWFELRAVSVRGVAKRAAPPDHQGGPHQVWYAIQPRRVLASDDGALRGAERGGDQRRDRAPCSSSYGTRPSGGCATTPPTPAGAGYLRVVPTSAEFLPWP